MFYAEVVECKLLPSPFTLYLHYIIHNLFYFLCVCMCVVVSSPLISRTKAILWNSVQDRSDGGVL